MQPQLASLLIRPGGPSQNAVARQLGLSKAAMCRLLKHGHWPVRDTGLRTRLESYLAGQRVGQEIIAAVLPAAAPAPSTTVPQPPQEDLMITKQVMSPQARRKWGVRDIFRDELSGPDDIFWSPEYRWVRETLFFVARHGGMLALVGESGAGKSVLRRDLVDRLHREDDQVVVIEPYVIGMDSHERRNAGCNAQQICEAVLTALSPSERPARSAEARFRQMHRVLQQSASVGQRHLLIIEEAHSIPRIVLKQLKRFYELEAGMTRLLSIILIGQQELKQRLVGADVREVSQRTEIVEMYPLDDLEGYVRHRCERAGGKFEAIFAADALAELPLRLVGPAARGQQAGKSLLYPLLVGNTLTRALNTAADLGLDKITADVIRSA